MDFWLVLSKNDSNIICSSIKNESFLKIWRVWHILKVCHALWYLKIEMSIAGSIFELHPPNFQKMCIFWRFTNDICTIFCYLHPVPGTCKWLNHVLKLLLCISMFGRVVLVPRSNISKICGQKFEEIRNNWKNTILGGIFCTSKCTYPAEAN